MMYEKIDRFRNYPLESDEWKEVRLARANSVSWMVQNDQGLEILKACISNKDQRTTDLVIDHFFEAQLRKQDAWQPGFGAKMSEVQKLSSLLEELPVRSTSLVARGSLQFLSGNHQGAHECYGKAVQQNLLENDFLDQSAWGCFTAVSSRQVALAAEEPCKPTGDAVTYLSEPKQGSAIYLATCDEVYFVAFAEALIESVLQFSPDAEIHFHIVNATGVSKKIIDGVPVNASFSIEHVDVQAHADIRAYYTCVRFLRASEFLERWSVPILFIDCDGVLKGDLISDCMSTCAKNTNMGFRVFYHFPAIHRWRRVSANCLLALPGTASQKFFRLFEGVFRSTYNQKHNKNWWIDHNIIDACLRYLSEHSPFHYSGLGRPSAQHLSLLHSKARSIASANQQIKALQAS